jgi:hypothetical protein
MTREQRRDLFEAVGLVAIVASLLFLALEVRQANLSTRIAARDSATQGHIDYLAHLLDSSILAPAAAKAIANQELSFLEKNQLMVFHELRWRHYERVYYQHQNGVISHQEWTGYESGITQSFREDNVNWKISRDAWERTYFKLSEDFATYVEELVADLR